MQRLSMLLGVFILLSLVLLGYGFRENEPCTNPAGESGRCVFFRDCEPLLNMYQKSNVTLDDSRFVQQSICGVTVDKKPRVCCVIPGDDPKVVVGLPSPPFCGANVGDRIDGGQRTSLDEYPWTALIEYRKPNGQTGFHCGASLINSRYVVTAAHCVKAIPPGWQPIGIRLGEWDLNSEDDCLDGECADVPVNVAIEKIIVHENYNNDSKAQYDNIALIRFTKDVPTSSFNSPICLPIDYEHHFRGRAGIKVWAAGWGQTNTASSNNIKQKVELEIQDLESCADIYGPSGIVLRDTQICVGGLHGQDTCSVDSGGSLAKPIWSFGKSNYFLYGVVSFGPNKCGAEDVPAVYTNVAKYIYWIKNNIE